MVFICLHASSSRHSTIGRTISPITAGKTEHEFLKPKGIILDKRFNQTIFPLHIYTDILPFRLCEDMSWTHISISKGIIRSLRCSYIRVRWCLRMRLVVRNKIGIPMLIHGWFLHIFVFCSYFNNIHFKPLVTFRMRKKALMGLGLSMENDHFV
jgi:hypothetical protein